MGYEYCMLDLMMNGLVLHGVYGSGINGLGANVGILVTNGLVQRYACFMFHDEGSCVDMRA